MKYSDFVYIVDSLGHLFNEIEVSKFEAFRDVLLLSRNIQIGGIEILRRRVKKYGAKIAVISEEKQLTYRKLYERSLLLANAFLNLGIRPGDKVGIILPNIPEIFEISSACVIAGTPLIPINSRLKAKEIEYILENSNCKALIHHKDAKREIENVRYPVSVKLEIDDPKQSSYESAIEDARKMVFAGSVADEFQELTNFTIERLKKRTRTVKKEKGDKVGKRGEFGIIIYTSGTTGRPKGAVRGAEPVARLLQFASAVKEFGLRSSDVHLVVCPLYHSAPFFFAQLYIALGGTLVILRKFRIENFLEAIHKYKVNTTFIVPYILIEILEKYPEFAEKFSISSLTHVICGAAPLSPHLKREFVNRFGPILYEFYGATETGINTILVPSDIPSKAESVGRPAPLNRIKIIDDNGRECPVGKEGVIYVSSPFVIRGYHKDDKATAESKLGNFFTAGDIGKFDEDGYLYVLDRKKDMIISGGVNIYPAEIENELLEHPSVKYVAVVGIPDEKWGEKVKAFVVLKEEYKGKIDEEELENFLRERLAGYKIPKEWAFVGDLPMTPSGKILKRELRNIS